MLENDETQVFISDSALKCWKSADGLLGYVQAPAVTFTDADTPDLEGDYFTAETYFGKRAGDGVDATLNHRIPIKTADRAANETLAKMSGMIFSHPIKTKKTPLELVAEHVLDLANEYEAFVYKLVEKGAFRWSGGSAPHLYDRQPAGKAYFVKRFDLAEIAYTPTAANPNNPRIQAVKSLDAQLSETLLDELPRESAGEVLDALKTSGGITINAQTVNISNLNDRPSRARTTTPNPEPEPETETTGTETQTELITMDETKSTTATPDPSGFTEAQVQDIATKAADTAVKAYQAQLDKTVVNDRYGFANGGEADEVDDMAARFPAMKNTPAARFSRFERGDSEAKALKAWMYTGDGGTAFGGVKLRGSKLNLTALKASNATIMNGTTAADGADLVPTGHVQAIAARRDEDMLARQLGCTLVPGVGLTVNHPFDNEADGEFVSTTEQVDAGTNTFDLDAPAVSKKAFTLVKYTKKVVLTDELQQDEASNLMAFLEDFIGRGMAKTHNNLLLTEVASNGTSLKTFPTASSIADGDLEDIEGNDDLGGYLDGSDVAWVMRNSTLSYIRQLGSTNIRHYSADPAGGGPGVQQSRSLLGYPVYRTNKAAAIAASAKTVYFGSWSRVGYRLAPDITILRDPYTTDGELLLKYYFRTVYGVLIAEAIGYGVHPTNTA